MKNDGPLMFINTVSSEKVDNPSQTVYDSRYSNKKNYHNENVEKSDIEFLEERKLHYIIEMYRRNKPVLCTVYVGTEEINGIPYEINGPKLKIKIDEKMDREIVIKTIKKIDIIKF